MGQRRAGTMATSTQQRTWFESLDLLRRTLNHKLILCIGARQQDAEANPGAFPFLALPRELREMVYDYFRHSGSHNVKIISTLAGQYIGFDALPPYREDPVPQQPPAASGFLAYYGNAPPPRLQLVCRQIHDELWDHFLSRTFEVGPLTPHADEWRFDPTYTKLAISSRLPLARNLLVRIDLASLQMKTRHGFTRFDEIGLEECVLKMQPLAEMLVRALRNRGTNLKLVLIDWKDDFALDKDWELKASVLYPFGTLNGVKIRLNKLEVAETGRAVTRKRLVETLDGLSAMA